eukprot:jgi/Ulvmu1/2170/UM013_0014.1
MRSVRGTRTSLPACTRWNRDRKRTVATRAAVKDHVQSIIDLCGSTDRGVTTSAETKAAILGEVEQLCAQTTDVETTGPALSATWKLIWTTEKESLFILEKAGLFGTKAGEVYQVIDVNSSTLQNVITFPPDGAFIVNSGITVASAQRVDFKFEAAALKVNGRKIPFPPFGQGWFDTVYLDDSVRIAQDIRGDTLIVARDGPPREFV